MLNDGISLLLQFGRQLFRMLMIKNRNVTHTTQTEASNEEWEMRILWFVVATQNEKYVHYDLIMLLFSKIRAEVHERWRVLSDTVVDTVHCTAVIGYRSGYIGCYRLSVALSDTVLSVPVIGYRSGNNSHFNLAVIGLLSMTVVTLI